MVFTRLIIFSRVMCVGVPHFAFECMHIYQEQVPVFTNFFSETQHHPRAELRFKPQRHAPEMPIFQQV